MSDINGPWGGGHSHCIKKDEGAKMSDDEYRIKWIKDNLHTRNQWLKHDFIDFYERVFKLSTLTRERDEYKARIENGLLLAPVDLDGEIADGMYLCWLGHNNYMIQELRRNRWWRGSELPILKAYDPLPEPGKEE